MENHMAWHTVYENDSLYFIVKINTNPKKEKSVLQLDWMVICPLSIMWLQKPNFVLEQICPF